MAFEISLRLPHLGLRMREHSARALLVARRLEDRGMDVVYPGLASHPHHEKLADLINPGYGFGGVLGLDVGSEERATELMRTLQNEERFGFLAVSLGYFDTLMSCSGSSTSSEMTEEDKTAARISPGLVRISVGYTGSVEQRWSQLLEALGRVGNTDTLQRSA